MKVCIVKQAYVTEFTWSSHRWSNAQELLKKFVLRSQNFGLVCETQADIWVVEDGEYISDTHTSLKKNASRALKALYQLHSAVAWSQIPWEDYDVVISLDSIIPDKIITQHPKILWCYYEQEHVKKSFQKSAKTPFGKYDLFLNHALNSKENISFHLPQAVNFPYLCSRKAFGEVIIQQEQDGVYLDSHCIRGVSNLKRFREQLTVQLGVRVRHCKPWDFKHSYLSVANKALDSTQDYLNHVASCRYFLLSRGGRHIGQSAPEAAALGVIILSSKGQIYSHHLCHPATWVDGRNYNSVAKVIERLQTNQELRKEIIEYQFIKVQDFFLEKPLSLLHKYLEVK